MDHEERIALATRVSDHVRHRIPRVVAVGVQGSTAKAEDRRHSDLEMVAIVRGASVTEAYQIIHEGIVVEVAFISDDDATRHVARLGVTWPMSADGWIHVLPIHDPGGLFPRLATRAASPDPAILARSARVAVTSMYEDLCKVRNFVESGDGSLVRVMCHGLALHGAARSLALMNRQYYNGVRNLLTKPKEFSLLPSHFWEDYPRLLAVEGETRDLVSRAERLYRGCWEMLSASGGTIPDDLTLEEKLERGRLGLRAP